MIHVLEIEFEKSLDVIAGECDRHEKYIEASIFGKTFDRLIGLRSLKIEIK